MNRTRPLRALGALTTFLATLAFTSWAEAAPMAETGFGYPRDVSLEGHRIDWLINVTAVFVTILFVIMCAWMALAVFKHGKDHEADYDHGSSTHAVVTALILSTGIFLIVDGNLLVNSVVDINEAFWNYDRALEAPEHLKIEVNAHQWAWDARYPGPDGEFGTADDIVTLNDIRVPVDRPVILQLASSDVIHSFSLPNLRIKQDAVPGNITQMWFQAKEIGEFDIACQQHCGTHHYKMKGLLTILTEEDFDTWHAHAAEVARLSHDPDDADAHWGWPWEEM